MATTVTKSIGSGGGRDYSAIALWEDDTDNTSLVTADEIRVGECYNDSEFLITSSLTIAGATVDATRYRKLTAASGQGFLDHANKLTNALTYDQSKGVGIRSTTGYLQMVVVSEACRIENLQFYYNSSGGRILINDASGAILRNLICKGNQVGVAITGASKLINSAVIVLNPRNGQVGAGVRISYPSTSGGIYNSTVVMPSDGTVTGTANGVETSSSSGVVKNTAVFGPWSARFSGTWNAASDYNATDAGTAPGSNSLTSLTYASQFEVVTTSGQDFRAKSGGSLAAGTRDATNTSDLDIVGQARSTTTPTIGAWEIAAAAATTKPWLYNRMMGM